MEAQKFFKVNDRVNVLDESDDTYYKAMLWDLTSSGLVITQPSVRQGRLDMKKGSTWEFSIESGDAVYTFESKVLKQQKGAAKPLYLIAYPQSMRRRQRRQFYRLDINLEVEYIIVTEGEKQKEEEEKKHDDILVEITEENEMFNDIKEFDQRTAGKDGADGVFPAFTVDISGGGMQIVSSKYLAAETEVLIKTELPGIKDPLKLRGKVVRSFPIRAGGSRKFRTALEFVDIDEKIREIIIQFIFDETRRRSKNIKV